LEESSFDVRISLRKQQKTNYVSQKASVSKINISNFSEFFSKDFENSFELKVLELQEKISNEAQNEQKWIVSLPTIAKEEVFLLKIIEVIPEENPGVFQQIMHEYELWKEIINNEFFLKLKHFSIRKSPKIKVFFLIECGICTITDILEYRHNYSEPEIAYILSQLIKSLTALKKLGISHRNLKLDNIILQKFSKNGPNNYKIFDFSLAFSPKLNNTEIIGITESYASPELIKAETYTNFDFFKADIYSLGIICLNLMGFSSSILKIGIKAIENLSFIAKYPRISTLMFDMLNENPEKRCDYNYIELFLLDIDEKSPDEAEFLQKIVERQENSRKNKELLEELSYNKSLINIYYKDFENVGKSLEIATYCYLLLIEFLKNLQNSCEEFRKYQMQMAYWLDWLAFLHKEKLEISQSLSYYEKALKLKLELFGENNEEITFTMKSLSEIHNELGNKQESLSFLQKALKIHLKLFGEKNSSAAITYHNIGLLEKSLGNPEKALENYGNSLRIIDSLPQNKEFLADLFRDIAKIYYSTYNDYTKTLEFLQKSLDIYQHSDENTVETLILIAETYFSMTLFEKSEEFYEKVLKIRLDLYGETNEKTLLTLNRLAELFRIQEDFNKAAEFYEKILLISQKISVKSEDYLDFLHKLAEVYYKKSDLKRNFELQEQSLPIIIELYGSNSEILAKTYWNLAEVTKILHLYENSLNFYEKSFEIFEIFSDFSEEKAQILEKMADLYEFLDQSSNEKSLLEKSLSFRMKKSSEGNEQIAVLLNRIGNLCYLEGKKEKAIELIEKALEINKRCYGEKDESNEIYIENLKMITKAL